MNTSLFVFLITLSAMFVEMPTDANLNATAVFQQLDFNENPYRLSLRLEDTENDSYNLVATVELNKGSWFVSPYSAATYRGYFQVILKENEHLKIDNRFVESPRSVAKYDKWQGGESHFVSENTSYSYNLSVGSLEDFKVLGMVQFVIEPKCTLEEIPFSISSESGKLSIQQYPKLDKSTCTKKI